MKCLHMSIKLLGCCEMQSKWIFMWTELVFTPVWNLKLVWVHFAYHVNILLLSGNTMQPEKTYSPYLPTVLHRAGHVRILLNILWYACIEKMSCIFKNPLKFSHIISYFHFYNDFIFRVFFKLILHSSRWPAVRNKNTWFTVEKRFSNWTCFTKQTCLLFSPMSKSYIL